MPNMPSKARMAISLTNGLAMRKLMVTLRGDAAATNR